jgi:chemotaxis protein CheX
VDVRIINPFLAAAVKVLATMAMIEPTPGKPFINEEDCARGTVSAVIGITGAEATGSMAITFTEPCIRWVVQGLLGVDGDEINKYIEDAVGEVTNMICGDARARLRQEGFHLNAGIPAIVRGEKHTIEHSVDGPRLAVPFDTPEGQFIVEVALITNKSGFTRNRYIVQ